ncbi:MAG: two-component system, NtrC family, C4-dicarboxylate transport response regulator DctD [Pseudomonadota bacterium]|jgi:two-component system C4-dicarboxylate transport response regulator DctD
MRESLSVVLVEDDPAVRLGCEQALQLEGLDCIAFESAEQARTHVGADFPGIVVSDVRLPGKDGLTLQRELRALDDSLPVVLITGHGDISMAVQAMKDGAYDFLEKPFAPEQLVDVVQRALDKRRLTREVQALRRQLAGRDSIEQRLIGRSPAMVHLRRLVLDVAATDADVLIYGETGCGKELVARCLHDYSPRQHRHFVPLNCGGLPETLFENELFGHEAGAFTGAGKRRIGKLEHADGGTLFLDEIESMPLGMQIKLLRVLQERCIERLGSNTPIPIQCRVVAASKEDLHRLADAGRFRADFYYRLNVVSITLPPLRERREDVPLLFEHFLSLAAARHQRDVPALETGLLRELLAHDWPGNVRELRNAAERYALGLRHDLTGARAPMSPAGPQPLARAVEAFERRLIEESLRQCDGNLTRAAERLQTPKATLHDKVRKYGL